MDVDFVATPDLGQKPWHEPRQYDAVTCMFAIHYFFVSEAALKQFLQNVASNLKDGACCPLFSPHARNSTCRKAGANSGR